MYSRSSPGRWREIVESFAVSTTWRFYVLAPTYISFYFPTKIFMTFRSYSCIHMMSLSNRTNGMARKNNIESRRDDSKNWTKESLHECDWEPPMRSMETSTAAERIKKLHENFCWRQIFLLLLLFHRLNIWWHGSFNIVNVCIQKPKRADREKLRFHFKYSEWCHYASTFWSQFTRVLK